MINIDRYLSKKQKATFVAGLLAATIGISDTTAQKAVKTAKIDGKGLYEIVVSQSTGAVYVAAAGNAGRGEANASGKVFKLDPKTLQPVDSIEVPGAKPMGLAINDKTQMLYTTSPGKIPMNAIDLKTKKVTAIEGGEGHLREVIVDEAKNLVYATNLGQESSIWVIDGKTGKFQHAIEKVGEMATALALDHKKQLIYVTLMKGNEIGVIDIASKKLVKTYSAHGNKPINLVLDSKGERLFVSDQGSNEVIVLKAADGELIKKIPAGKGALGVRFDAGNKRIYTANRGDGTVTVINSDTYEVVVTLEAGSAPNTVAINPKTGIAYVTNKTKPQPRQPRAPRDSTQTAAAQKPAERPAPAPDPNGDTVTMISPK